jgi:hypothetical protein
MTVAIDIVTRSLKLLGVLWQNEVPDASLTTDMLALLNGMIESWNLEGINSYTVLTQHFPFTGGTNTYTVGPTGTWVGTRPLQIIGIPYVRDANGYDYPVQTLDLRLWDILSVKNLPTAASSDIPSHCYYRPDYPNGTMQIWPVPVFPYQFYFDCNAPLADLIATNSPLNLPQGYERAYTYNLAIEASGMFPNRPLPPAVVRVAAESKSWVKTNNLPSLTLSFDTATRQSRPRYNIYRDTPA